MPVSVSLPLDPELVRLSEAVAFQKARIGSKLYKKEYADVYALPEFQKNTRRLPHLRRGWSPKHDPTCISDAVECFNATKAGKKLLEAERSASRTRAESSAPSAEAEPSASNVNADQSLSRILTIGTDCSGMEVPIMVT